MGHGARWALVTLVGPQGPGYNIPQDWLPKRKMKGASTTWLGQGTECLGPWRLTERAGWLGGGLRACSGTREQEVQSLLVSKKQEDLQDQITFKQRPTDSPLWPFHPPAHSPQSSHPGLFAGPRSHTKLIPTSGPLHMPLSLLMLLPIPESPPSGPFSSSRTQARATLVREATSTPRFPLWSLTT